MPISLLRIGHKRTKQEMEALATWQFAPGPYILQCPNCIGTKVELSEKEELMSDAESMLADILGDDIDDIDGMMSEMEHLLG